KALVRLRELERDAQVSRRSYEELLERSQQAELFEDLAEADARVADRASVPTKPSFPHAGLNILLGLFLGTALGGMMVVLTEIFDNGLRTQEDIERQLGMGTLTLIPQLSKDKLTEDISTPQDYVVERPLSAFAESYRTLRTGLVLGAKSGKSKKGGRVVALTSAVSGEGKTSSALCLGRISALAGDKVLVIDCDIRRRMLSAAFEKDLFEKQEAEDMGAAAEIELRGLAELIRGDVPFRTVVMRDEKTELDILPVSKDHSGVGDLFGTARFKVLLEKLRARYDLIILDTPPLTAVAEARAAVNAADVAVQCVRWKKTPLALAKSAAKILRGIKTPLAGAALTQVDMRAQAGYGYEGSYKYYAQHGKYYFD
ncbi:MAG: AAA family ATPase, partial [Pseudomonadota bacterium]